MKKTAFLFLFSLLTLTGFSQGTPPAWSSLRYSYSEGLLKFEGTATVGQLKFERIDGIGFSTTNPNGVAIASGTFYGSGGNDDATYSKQWQLYYSGPQLRITTEEQGTSAVYSYTLTPVAGASAVSLPVSVTSIPPPSVTVTLPTANTALKTIIDNNLAKGAGPITAAKLKTIMYALSDATLPAVALTVTTATTGWVPGTYVELIAPGVLPQFKTYIVELSYNQPNVTSIEQTYLIRIGNTYAVPSSPAPVRTILTPGSAQSLTFDGKHFDLRFTYGVAGTYGIEVAPSATGMEGTLKITLKPQ